MSNPPIVILGAGIAGLALGRYLRRHSLPAILFEKATSKPRNNYGITLHEWAYRPLLNLLEIDEYTFRERLSVDASNGGTGRLSTNLMSPIAHTATRSFRCHRGKLELLLREGLDIRWAHTSHNIETSSTRLSITFQDDQHVEAEIIIAADGVHSQTRQLLAPEVTLKVLPYVVFYGRRSISLKVYQEILEAEMQGTTLIQARHGDILLETSLIDMNAENVNLSYTYSRPARGEDALHKPNRPTTGATDIPDELYQEIELLQGLEKPFAYVFDCQKIRGDRVLHWLMRSTLVPLSGVKDLVNRGVLLVGDAAHAMPILGGEGANLALKDAIELGEHIVRHGTTRLDDFVERRHEPWKTFLQESEARLADMHSGEKASL